MRAGQGKQRKSKHPLPQMGSFQPPRDCRSLTAFGSRTVGAGDAAARMVLSPGIAHTPLLPLHNSCHQAAMVVAHTVVLTHMACSFCFSLCCQCDKAVGLCDGCSLSLHGYTGVLVCFKKKKLIFGWQLLNCTVPLCAAGTASAERVFLSHFIRFICFQGDCVFSGKKQMQRSPVSSLAPTQALGTHFHP